MRPPAEVLRERLEELLPYGRQEVVAGLAGVTGTTLSRWRNGRLPINPTLDTLAALAQALGVPIERLISDPETEPPAPRLPPDTADALLALVRAAIADGVIPRERLAELLRETAT